MVAIGSHLNSLSGVNAFARHQRAMNAAMERLATGRRINRASDDPAGMVAAHSLASQRVSLEEIIRQAELGSAMLDAADAGMAQVSDMVTELNGLVVHAANTGGLSAAEREALQVEADSIVQAIDHLTSTYTFNGKKILTEAGGFQAGDTYVAVPTLAGGQLDAIREFASGGRYNLTDGDIEHAQEAAKTALQRVGNARASIGSMRRYTLGAEVDSKRIQLENVTDAESKVVDTDFAAEVATAVREKTLTEASIAIIQMSQRQAGQVLRLLG